MRTILSCAFALSLALVACGVTDGAPVKPIAGHAAPGAPPLYSKTEPAPAGSVLRVFVEPTRIVGWIGGSTSFAGTPAQIRIAGRDYSAPIDGDNTFALSLRVERASEAVVRVGSLVQHVTVAPVDALDPSAFIVADRGAYRPGQKLGFTAFLRRLDDAGEHRPVANAKVEVQIVSETRKTTAAKLALVADAGGRITGEYTFSSGDPLDLYSISIPGYRGAARVTLAEFRKTKVKLDIDTAIADGVAEVKFRALDFLDKPVPGGTVSFTAQIVREDREAEPPARLDPSAFAYGPAAGGLRRDEVLLLRSLPELAGRLFGEPRQVITEVKGKVALDAKGAGSYQLPIRSEHVRGHHQLLVDAVIVDANGREQRTTRTAPLARGDVRLQLAAGADLVVAGKPLDITARLVDASGKLVVPVSASIAAIRVDPPVPQTLFYGGYNYGGNNYYANNLDWNGNGLNLTPNGGALIGRCQFTSAGCRRWQRARAPRVVTGDPTETLAATAAVVGELARLSLDDPGAYRLVANARLADGSSVWSELGIAVRDNAELPPLVLELDRDEVRQGDRITGRLQGRYRDAAVLLVVRDARGIQSRHRVVLANGRARIDLPAGDRLGYGAAVEAFVLGADAEVYATQELLRVLPTKQQLAIRTTAKESYGPGETVELDIAVDQAQPVELVVSVYDQSLLGVAPDRAVDPSSFYLTDDRLRGRAALHTLRAELGDVTIEALLARARARVKRPVDDGDPASQAQHDEAKALVAMFERGSANAQAIAALLRFAGVQASAGYTSWTFMGKALLAKRVIDVLEHDMKALTFERVTDAIVIGDLTQGISAPQSADLTIGGVSGNSSYSAGGNMAFSAPAGPTPMQISDGTLGVVRRDFSDSAFWSATTRTDATGKARVRFKLPDSLTNWQVVVTAVTPDMRVGRHVSKLRTVRDVMIWPMLPRQFTEGDVVSIFGTVHNLTAGARDIVVTLEAEHAEILSPATVTIRVPAGTNVPVTWSVRTREPGMASLLMRATGTGTSDASLKRIPIVASVAEQIVTASGFADRPLTIDLPDGIDPKRATLELSFAPSLAADLVQTLDYLVEYPYGCAEQTMSRFAPAIRVAGILDHLGIKDGALARRLPGVVDGGMKRLAGMQQPDGGWGWNGHAETHEMITPYVVWGLIEAEKAGYKLPDSGTITRGLARVRSLYESRHGDASLSDRTYLMYVYSQRHRLPDAWWSELAGKRAQLSDYALALALEMAVARDDDSNAERMAAELRSRVRRGNGGAYWRTGNFSRWMEDPFETSAVVMKALVAHDPNDALIAEVIAYFVANKRGDRWNSTKDTAMILYAMTEFLGRKGVKSGTRDAFVDYAVNGGVAQHLGFTDGLARKVVVDGSKLARRTTLTFAKASPGMMARAVLRFRKSGRDLAPASYGLDVTRQLFLVGAKGVRIKQLATGDRVPRGAYLESVVTVAHGQHETMRFLLVEDPKPAGAEALPLDDPRFPRVPTPWVLREDRESHLAFHHEEAPATTSVRTFLHLEMHGELVIAPAQAELMYQTTTRGHSGSFVLRVD